MRISNQYQLLAYGVALVLVGIASIRAGRRRHGNEIARSRQLSGIDEDEQLNAIAQNRGLFLIGAICLIFAAVIFLAAT